MSRFQQGSVFKLKRKSIADVWVFRWYENTSGKRTYKKQIIGNVTKLRNRWGAEKTVIALTLSSIAKERELERGLLVFRQNNIQGIFCPEKAIESRAPSPSLPGCVQAPNDKWDNAKAGGELVALASQQPA